MLEISVAGETIRPERCLCWISVAGEIVDPKCAYVEFLVREKVPKPEDAKELLREEAPTLTESEETIVS